MEQVFTMNNKDSVDVIYLGITNIENIVKLKKNYNLLDFNLKNNNEITFERKKYKYNTVEKIDNNNNIEYVHKIYTNNWVIKYNLINILTCYKRIRSNIDNTDIIFKFMGSSFTLEDVRIVYELIKDTTVDKSNYRKKIIKYCEKVESKESTKNGFRPSQKFKFKPLKGDL